MQSKNVSTFWRSRQVLDYNDQNTKSPSCNKSLYTLTNKEIIPSPKNGGVQNHLFKKKKRRPKLVSIHNFIPTDPPNLFAMI